MERVKAIFERLNVSPKAIPPRFFLPAVNAASLEDDPALQKQWAALLANAANPNFESDILLAFSEILRELTPTEAKFLSLVYDQVLEDEREQMKSAGPPRPGAPPMVEPWASMREETRKSANRVMLSNLERLGLLERSPSASINFSDRDFFALRPYYVTPFGRAFLRACRVPETTPDNMWPADPDR